MVSQMHTNFSHIMLSNKQKNNKAKLPRKRKAHWIKKSSSAMILPCVMLVYIDCVFACVYILCVVWYNRCRFLFPTAINIKYKNLKNKWFRHKVCVLYRKSTWNLPHSLLRARNLYRISSGFIFSKLFILFTILNAPKVF